MYMSRQTSLLVSPDDERNLEIVTRHIGKSSNSAAFRFALAETAKRLAIEEGRRRAAVEVTTK